MARFVLNRLTSSRACGQPGAAPWPRGGRSYTGLYHFAILLPTRAALGRWLRHRFELGLPMPGQGDDRRNAGRRVSR